MKDIYTNVKERSSLGIQMIEKAKAEAKAYAEQACGHPIYTKKDKQDAYYSYLSGVLQGMIQGLVQDVDEYGINKIKKLYINKGEKEWNWHS